MEGQKILIILMGVVIGVFAWSWAAGYLHLEWYYFVGVLAVLGGVLFFGQKRMTKLHGWRECIDKNREDLLALGVIGHTGYNVNRASRVDENMDLNDRGRYWYIVFGTGPNYNPLVFSVKTGNMVHVDLKGKIDESPLKSLRDKPKVQPPITGKHEIEYKEKVTPERPKPASE